MSKYQNDLNRVPVAIIIKDGGEEVGRYITEKVIGFGGEVIKEDIYIITLMQLLFIHLI